jgi:hypothetical protein
MVLIGMCVTTRAGAARQEHPDGGVPDRNRLAGPRAAAAAAAEARLTSSSRLSTAN